MRDNAGTTKQRRPAIKEDPRPLGVDVAPRDAVIEEFSRNLQSAMNAKGWNQSEMARAATMQMGGEGEVHRDNISKYINGKTLPTSPKLAAIAKALGVPKDQLFPTTSVLRPAIHTPPIGVHDAGDGKAWLRINQAVRWDVALKILEMVKGDECRDEE